MKYTRCFCKEKTALVYSDVDKNKTAKMYIIYKNKEISQKILTKTSIREYDTNKQTCIQVIFYHVKRGETGYENDVSLVRKE